jgi:hypothetical protein
MKNQVGTNGCKPCKKKHPFVAQKANAGIFTSILIVLLPKCPFCLMAYSSTMMLCGANGVSSSTHHTASVTSIFVTSLFCLVAVACIIFNYRGTRTKYAIALALAGSTLIIYSVAKAGGLPVYYAGNLLLFTGVWLNASLLGFVKKIETAFSKTKAAAHTVVSEN